MIDLSPMQNTALFLLDVYHGMRSEELRMKLVQEFSTASTHAIDQAISELVQAKKIIRVEYQLKENRSLYYAFYLPEGARLV